MMLSRIFKGDKAIWVVFLLLSIVSLVEVYSSIGLYAYTAFSSKTPSTLFLRHLLVVAVTWVVAIALTRVNYRYFSRFAVLGYWASFVLLAVMLMIGGRWFRVPVIGQFQPSEVAKVALIPFVARLLALNKDKVDDLGTFLQLLVYIGFVVALVLPENFSTAALIFLSCYLMMLFGGVNRKYWWRLFLVGMVLVVAGLAVTYYRYDRSLYADAQPQKEQLLERSSTWGHRVHSWVHPDTLLTQENMARMAIARGGAFGKGPGNTVHARLMTQAHNDFIYAIIIEETGLVGGILVFLLYSFLYFRCIRLSWRCKGRFGALTVAGMGTMIYLQAVANMCVAVGVLPVTGQTLPFISYGGTAYLFLGCGLGIIQSVAAEVYGDRKEASGEGSIEGQNEQTVHNGSLGATVEVNT
ncbi:MAG: FtsW/RodA/SpoVE family cell cycle protein [Bacteroidales bacterium]|nr:FtsW/RodA/SpoVE family cell cycle protein [Bacteroidales bacterium]